MSSGPRLWQTLLEAEGLAAGADVAARLGAYLGLVREFNPVAGLVSVHDVGVLEEVHLPDCLSLAPVIARLGLERGLLLDIGSGGGFPAVPLGIVLPELRGVLVERNGRKSGFLRKVQGDLGLKGFRVVSGEFPQAGRDVQADVVTARAVEAPVRVWKDLAAWLPPGAVYLCQTGAPVSGGGMFHVEHVSDAWTLHGLRRGSLQLVRRAGASNP